MPLLFTIVTETKHVTLVHSKFPGTDPQVDYRNGIYQVKQFLYQIIPTTLQHVLRDSIAPA